MTTETVQERYSWAPGDIIITKRKEFDESLHPRDEKGEFTDANSVPTAPGTTPIAPGEVRAFHFTKLENADKIRKEGLKPVEGASNVGSGEPAAVWGYEAGSGRGQDPMPGEAEAMVEYRVHPDKGDYLLKPGSGQVASYTPVPPQDIIAVHERWHDRYRYAVENGQTSQEDIKFMRSIGGSYAKAADRMEQDIASGKLKEFDELLHPRDDHGRFADAEGATDESRMGQLLAKTGGFSYQIVSNKQPTDGKMVALPGHERIIEHRPSVAEIRQYIKDNEDVLSEPDKYAGGWLDTESGKVYLDVSVRVETAEEADRLSREYKQEAYYDISTGESVYTRAREEKATDLLPQGHDGRGDSGSNRQALRETIGQRLARAIRGTRS